MEGSALMAAKVRDGFYRCPKCRQVKPKDDFYAPPTKNTEVSHYCKECHRERQREARLRLAQGTA